MLVLGRTDGEGIRIGEGKDAVTVWFHGPCRVTVAIDAPKEVPILRTELLEAGRTDVAGERSPRMDAN